MDEAKGELLHEDITYAIIGCAQKVHGTLGPGFPESVYERAMSQELMQRKMPFETQRPYEVWYEGVLCGEFRLDMLVEGKVIVELKAVANRIGDHLAQALSYLKVTGLHVGLLLNFGRKSLQTQRVAL
ncbi:MAG: GxxExxY protein [Planctomycetota bacterium]|nr:GxxExxY protein [Planctomycetota bacterium]